MKNILKISLLFAVMIFAGEELKAQDSKVSLNLNYNYSFPTGNFNSDVISHNSPRGFTGNLMYRINPLISVGFSTGYQDYYQKYPRDVYDFGDGQKISAVISNSVQTVPLMARAEVYPFGYMHTRVQPYVSAATGLNIVDYNQYLGEFPQSSTRAGYRLQGGLGVKVPFVKNTAGFDLGGTYDYAPFKRFGLKNLDNYNVHAGLYIWLK